MKKTQVTMLVNEEREMKIRKSPSMAKVLFNAFFWVLLVIVESYLWIFKGSFLVQWVKDLKVLWIGLAIGSLSTIALYIYCYSKHYVIKLKKLNLPSISAIFTMVITIFRGCEFIMMVTHFKQFASFWTDGILPFIVFMWISGVSVLAFVRANFIRKKRRIRANQRRYSRTA